MTETPALKPCPAITVEQRLIDYFAEIESCIDSIGGALRHRQQPQDYHFHTALKACRDGTDFVRRSVGSAPNPDEGGSIAPNPSLVSEEVVEEVAKGMMDAFTSGWAHGINYTFATELSVGRDWKQWARWAIASYQAALKGGGRDEG